MLSAVASVADFYTDKELFVTGATGYLGKSFLEKLLFACPGIKVIYLLLRPKRGALVDQRLEELKKDFAFDRIRSTNASLLDKLVAIEGDVRELGLRMTEASVKRIANVSILIHGAATVRFDEPLKESVLMNTRGTREVLELAKKLKKLQLFAHISTAYTNPQQEMSAETLYPIECDWRSVINMVEKMDVNTLEALSKKFVGYHPNSYTYSKQLSEHMVNDYRNDLPIIIHRPSIVSPSTSEPTCGWVDNFNGPVGLMIPVGIGFSRVLLGDRECRLNFVPVDYVSNSLVSIIAQSATKYEEDKGKVLDQVPIFNYGVPKSKAVPISQIMLDGIRLVKKYPMDNVVWYPNSKITKSLIHYKLHFYLFQLLPGLIAELVLKAIKNDFSILRILRKIYYVQVSLYHFMTNQFDFRNENLMQSFKMLTESDQQKFFFGKDMDFPPYMAHALHGAKRYLLNQQPIPSAKTVIKLRILTVLHYSLMLGAMIYALRWVFQLAVPQ